MIGFFANLFGYVLNFLYEFVGNFGWAILLFSVLVKVIMIPISIKQQKTMEKSQRLSKEMKNLQFKYKNDPEKFNQEMMDLYKREKMSPFSGCLSSIIQIILLFSVFYLVRSPLTYMRKIDSTTIDKLQQVVVQEGSNSNYREIAVINYINKVKNGEITKNEEEVENQEEQEAQEDSEKIEQENVEQIENSNTEVQEENNENIENSSEQENKEEININDYVDEAYINMEFLGLDLSKVPTEDLTNIKTLIIPILYVISSIVSIKLSTKMTNQSNEKTAEGEQEYDAMAEANKSMNMFMPIMSVLIALIAPLGLALYWLANNILMIIERIVLNKFFKNKEEAKENA